MYPIVLVFRFDPTIVLKHKKNSSLSKPKIKRSIHDEDAVIGGGNNNNNNTHTPTQTHK